MAERAISSREVTRRCAVTRETRPEHELLRFVADADGVICFDLKRKLPGRGVWITASKPILAEAVKRKAFNRSLRRNVQVPAELPDRVEDALRRDALNRLSLANKAGQAVAGFAKVAQAIDKGKAAALIHAEEAAPDGCRRLDRKFIAQGGDEDKARAVRIFRFPLEVLSQALGRDNVNHAAALQGGAGTSFIAAAMRLCQFTGDGIAQTGGPSRGETSAGNAEPAKQDTE
ncbi:RNA-binding protein [Dichotomicrobium thermohalophilum]|uniref:RNA-binding protein n=1 Tax=Dichotomicrobium thermohalophilum TaxID=933063 RepID=UPI001476679E|nr:RNA-binding protein [Dichotomicrobium thermohalophilum]